MLLSFNIEAMATILLTGGTGLIGSALTKALMKKGYAVIVLSRKKHEKASNDQLSFAQWDINRQFIDESAFAKADYIIHLAGAGVAEKRWTKKRKQEILDSRVKSSELLVKALNEIPNKVKAVISASAIGWYGADLTPGPSPNGEGGRSFVEKDPAANDFLGSTCLQWEKSIDPVTARGKRLVKLRTGIVLSKDGGALKEFIKPLRLGVAAILGNGKQAVSWIHINDLVNLYISAMENESFSGVYNAVAPAPVSNKTLVNTLARERNGRWYLPFRVPSFVLRMVLGEMSIEVLKSATVSSRKIQDAGFQFQYPGISEALKALLTKP